VKRLKNMLCHIDGEPALGLLQRAVRWCHQHGARLTVGDVVEPPHSHELLPSSTDNAKYIQGLIVDDRRRQLDEAIEKIESRGVAISTRVLVGDPLETILGAVQEYGFDFVAKEWAPAQGVRKRLFGSIDTKLMGACPCPVAIGRPRTDEEIRRIVVALDYDANDDSKARLNQHILDTAVVALAGESTELYVVHAWSMYGESILAHGRGKVPPERFEEELEKARSKRQQWLDSLIDSYRAGLDEESSARFSPRLELLRGDPRVVIPSRVNELEADILSLGTVARRGLSGLLIGNTSEEILDRVDCTVVLNKPVGFLTASSES